MTKTCSNFPRKGKQKGEREREREREREKEREPNDELWNQFDQVQLV